MPKYRIEIRLVSVNEYFKGKDSIIRTETIDTDDIDWADKQFDRSCQTYCPDCGDNCWLHPR